MKNIFVEERTAQKAYKQALAEIAEIIIFKNNYDEKKLD